MNKNKLYFLLIICLILIPLNTVYATDLKYDFEVYAVKNVVSNAGDVVNLKFSVSTENYNKEAITACKFKVTPNSGLTLVEEKATSGWKLTTGQLYLIETEGVGEKNSVILESEYKVNETSSIKISDIYCEALEPNEAGGKHDDITIDLKIIEGPTIKINGKTIIGSIETLSANKKDFVFSATSSDISEQNNIKVEFQETKSGNKIICAGEECLEKTIEFSDENLCSTAACQDVKNQIGDHILVKVYSGSTSVKEIYISKEISSAPTLDPTLKYLKVWGIEVELEKGKTEYEIEVPANVTDYTVEAELSDPDNFVWDDEDRPSKYNFKTNTINLIFHPKNTETIGASTETYVIKIKQDGEQSSSEPSSSSPPSSSSQPPSSSQSSSNKPITNPQTGGISQFIIAIILFVSLLISLSLYKKNMEDYK